MTHSEKPYQMNSNSVTVSYLKLAIENISLAQAFLLGLVTILIIRSFLSVSDNVDAQPVGFRSRLEPSFLVRLRFAKGALPQINEGYQKVVKPICTIIPQLQYCTNDGTVQKHVIQDLQK